VLTGDPSQGYGVEVVGEAPGATPAAPETPAAPDPAATDPAAPETEAPPATEYVELPSNVSGSTAAQLTCTVAQR